jgi:hypothetical protein
VGGVRKGHGGGIYVSGGTVTIEDCTIDSNSARTGTVSGAGNGYGGGIALFSVDSAHIYNNTINDNTTSGSSSSSGLERAAGIYLECTDRVYLKYNTIQENACATNSMASGDAFYAFESDFTMKNCLITDNATSSSNNYGSFMVYADDSAVTDSIINCTIALNDYGGLRLDGDSLTARIKNNIIAFNTGVGGYGIYNTADDERIELAHNCVYGHTDDYYGIDPGTGDFSDDDPDFSDTTNQDYHLDDTSPCIDSGSNFAWIEWTHDETDPTDLDGVLRFQNGNTTRIDCNDVDAIKVDIGCYEDTIPGDTLECGDANNSCLITTGDGFLIINDPTDARPRMVGDVNLSGSVTSADGYYILNWLSGGDYPAPCSIGARIEGVENAEVWFGTPRVNEDRIEIPIRGTFGVPLMGYVFGVRYNSSQFVMLDPDVIDEVDDGIGTLIWHADVEGGPAYFRTSGCTWKEGWERDTIDPGEGMTLMTLKLRYLGDGTPNYEGLELVDADLPDLHANLLNTTIVPGFVKGRGVMGVGSDFQFPFKLLYGKPNPFDQTTDIWYSIGENCLVEVVIYDASGRRIRTLVNERQSPGVRTATWDGADDLDRTLAPGVYFCKMRAADYEGCRKLVLMR